MATSNNNREIISLGVHASEVDANLQAARSDQIFTPLLVDAGFLPYELRNARIVPAVTYGIEANRPTPFGAVELLPGSGALIQENIGSPYFNPHLSVRTRAHNLVDRLTSEGKGSQRVKGKTFGLPSYIMDNQAARYLFVGGDESDLEILGNEYAEKLAVSYDIGHIVLGSEVVVGDVKAKLGHVSVPTLIREIGQTISDLDVSHAKQVEILKAAHHSYEEKKSPDYRPYMKYRKHWPGKKR